MEKGISFFTALDAKYNVKNNKLNMIKQYLTENLTKIEHASKYCKNTCEFYSSGNTEVDKIVKGELEERGFKISGFWLTVTEIIKW